jgi:hypothetical protein
MKFEQFKSAPENKKDNEKNEEIEKTKKDVQEEEFGPIQSKEKTEENKEKLKEKIEQMRKSLGL